MISQIANISLSVSFAAFLFTLHFNQEKERFSEHNFPSLFWFLCIFVAGCDQRKLAHFFASKPTGKRVLLHCDLNANEIH